MTDGADASQPVDPRLIGTDHNGGEFTRHLPTLELALRWNMSPRSLERWRRQGRGPRYIGFPRKVVYRLADVEMFEAERLRVGTARGGTAVGEAGS